MCTGNFEQRVKQSFNPEHEFRRSLTPKKAIGDAVQGITPDMPELPAPPPPPQEVKMPDMNASRRTLPRPRGNGTLLTGPGGVTRGTFNTGGSTLLGG